MKTSEHAEYKGDRMEKACSSKLDRMAKRLGPVQELCSSINDWLGFISKAIESSSTTIS